MVARQRSPTVNIAQLQMMETETLGKIEGMTTLDEGITKEGEMVPWRNVHDMRPRTLAALASVKALRPNHPLFRMSSRNMTSAAKSLDILRQNLQSAINKEIDLVIKKYLEKFFQPAVRNIRDNLGITSVTEDMIWEVCRAMLEEAKQMYCPVSVQNKGTSPPSESEFTSYGYSTDQKELVRKRKADEEEMAMERDELERQAYPPYVKWDPARVNKATHFILSTTAAKILGVGAMKEKLTTRHPDLVKYMIDQDDREWLSSAGISGLVQATPSLALFLLEDIIQLANFDDYRQNAVLYVSELKGFTLPDFIQRKVRAYMTLMRTKYILPEAETRSRGGKKNHQRLPSPKQSSRETVVTRHSCQVEPQPEPQPELSSTSHLHHHIALSPLSPCQDVNLTFDEAYLLSSSSDLECLSSTLSETNINEMSCVDPSAILPSYIRIQQPIQMSVGVECLSPETSTFSTLDNGAGSLTEFESSFLSFPLPLSLSMRTTDEDD